MSVSVEVIAPAMVAAFVNGNYPVAMVDAVSGLAPDRRTVSICATGDMGNVLDRAHR